MDLILKRENGACIYKVVYQGHMMGYVAIDSTIRGGSCGGLGMLLYIEEDEICTLAESMTLKYGFLGLPQGGAKAGVIGDPEAPRSDRLKRLVEFGQSIKPLLKSKTFIPTSDMGTSNADIRYMLNAVGIQVGRRELQDNLSGWYTAHSVLAGVIQSSRFIGLDLSNSTVAIEGFGNVGRPLGSLLAKMGVKVVAISTSQGGLYNPQGLDINQLVRLANEVGSHVVEIYQEADWIERENLLELPVDILCPCARWNSIRVDNEARIQARILCPGANNPITPAAERTLFKRGVLCLPDFVTNCGGVLGGTMEFASIRREKITTFINRHIGTSIAWLLKEATDRNVLPRDIVSPLAIKRFKQVQRTAEHPNLLGGLLNVGLEFYRRGWIPRTLVAPLSFPYFQRIIPGLIRT